MQAIYRGLVTFAKDDPDVLHFDPEVHLAKLLRGGYAFIGDAPTLELWAARHCELAVLDATISGLESYSFFTQKNSTLTKDIQQV